MKHKRAQSGSRGRGFPRFSRIQHLEALLVPLDKMLLHSRVIPGVFPRYTFIPRRSETKWSKIFLLDCSQSLIFLAVSSESSTYPYGQPSWLQIYRVWPGDKFLVGSLPCTDRFSSGYSGFPLSSKTNTCKFQFDQESGRRRTTKWMCYLQIVIYLFYFIYLFMRSAKGGGDGPFPRLYEPRGPPPQSVWNEGGRA